MGRILGIDYGTKRVGLAVTDELRIIATALATIKEIEVISYIENYLKTNNVEAFVVGLPLKLDGTDTHATQATEKFVSLLAKKFPHLPVYRVDERFTSKIAQQTLLQMGLNKKQRASKENVDMISAVLILQTYLDSI
ncbi:MAG: Holliday junction resolvase RuvX [Bacteroidia bacterium]